jgi:hypothetical protein
VGFYQKVLIVNSLHALSLRAGEPLHEKPKKILVINGLYSTEHNCVSDVCPAFEFQIKTCLLLRCYALSLLTPAADSLAPARSALAGLRLRRIPMVAFPSNNSLPVRGEGTALVQAF